MSHSSKWCLDTNRIKTFGKQVFHINRHGNKRWYLNGKQHRVNGPAAEYTIGAKWWYLNDQLHRENGPAVELANGTKRWYLNGIHYSESDYWKELNKWVIHLSGVWIKIN